MPDSFIQRIALRFRIFFFILYFMSSALYADSMMATAPMNSFAGQNFWQLNNAITTYQALTKQPWPNLPAIPHILKVGTKSPTITALRHRLILLGDLKPAYDLGGPIFDAQVNDAVKQFQARHGIKADGIVGETTREALDVTPDERIKQIAINMQRWATLANQINNRFILVNIPDFHMYVFNNNQEVLSMKAIVGKRDLPTPELNSTVTRIVLNPAWNVPPTIARRDIIPKMLSDPNYLDHAHIRVFRDEDDESTEINPHAIDWQSADVDYHFRQDPGQDNALGLIKFEFENAEDIYMHDTPAKELFNTDIRDYSHGCIRLENPFALADYLMQDNPNWNKNSLQTILDAKETRYVKIPRPIPIFITYITAWVDEKGHLNFRDDVYKQDDDPS